MDCALFDRQIAFPSAEEPQMKERESPPAVVEEIESSPIQEHEEDPDYETIIAKHRQKAEGYVSVPIVAEYRPPAEGSLREEMRKGGWKHVFAYKSGKREKSHRISPGGQECLFTPQCRQTESVFVCRGIAKIALRVAAKEFSGQSDCKNDCL